MQIARVRSLVVTSLDPTGVGVARLLKVQLAAVRPAQQSRRQPSPKWRLVISNGSALRSLCSVTI